LHAYTAGQRLVDPAEAVAALLLTTGVATQQLALGLEAHSVLWRGHLAGKKVMDDYGGAPRPAACDKGWPDGGAVPGGRCGKLRP
jgi:hypothetical protein